LYAQLSHPSEIAASDPDNPSSTPFIFAPLENRLGHTLFETATDRKLLMPLVAFAV
jgi:hypothetical protein